MNITKEQFEKFVEVQKSGVTNMYHTDMVQSLTGLTGEQIIEIMENYEELEEKYPEVV